MKTKKYQTNRHEPARHCSWKTLHEESVLIPFAGSGRRFFIEEQT
jgi:hypothetical protein